MLAGQGIVSEPDRDALLAALDAVERELEEGTFPVPAGRRGHPHGDRAARHRARRPGRRPAAHRALAQRPGRDRHGAVHARPRAGGAAGDRRRWPPRCSTPPSATSTGAMPGYTHLQRAQPVYLGHHLLAYVWMLARDRERFAAVEAATAKLPLGAGALAGVNFDTDRGRVAAELGFAGVAENSIDAVSNRDFVLDYLAAAATCATHLSRLGAEIVLWSSSEFGFCRGLRRVGVGLLDHAAEEEPRRGRAAAREGAAGRRPPRRAPRRDARAPADLQQGHAGGQGAPLRRGRHARAVPRGGRRDDRGDRASTASGWPRRRATRCSPRPTSQTCSCAAGCRSASRTASSRRSSSAPSTAAARSPSCAARSSTEHSELLDDEYYAVLRGDAWLESKVSEGGTSLRRVREQLERARALLA